MEAPGAAAAPSPGAAKRKVMVVAEPGRESAGALQWALTHAVLEQDEIILLYVDLPNPSRRGPFSAFLRRPPPGAAVDPPGGGGGGGGGGLEFLDEMKGMCLKAQPRVAVQVLRVEMEDNDKVSTIVSQTKALAIDLLVIGQSRRPSFLGGRLGGGTSSKNMSMDMVEYLIENSRCLCVGVQKKGQNAGYLLNTKTHKNFWLLA